jgi:hypothetical protein
MGHSLISPSGVARAIACTRSTRLEQQFPDTTSSAAAEGTLAHRLGDLLILRKLGRIHKKAYDKELADILADPLYDTSMWDFMEDYSVFVIEQFHTAQAKCPDAEILTETKVDLGPYIPEGEGTVDVQIRADHVLWVTDLKYGKGVPVSAKENSQLMCYGLGALLGCDWLYDIHTLRLTIYQPRIDNISTWEISVDQLRAWAQEILIPRAKMAFAGEGEFNPGSWCRFCRAKATCRAHAEYNLEMAEHEFKDPALLTPAEVSDVLKRTDMLVNWAGAVGDYALAEALNGAKFPDFKVVEGRSNRVYTDTVTVIKMLRDKQYKDTEIFQEPKIKGIGELEKELGKDDFNRIVGPFLAKPSGKPTLVPADDKRPEINSIDSAIEAFS